MITQQKLRSFLSKIMSPPWPMKPRQRWLYGAGAIAYPMAMLVHVALIFLYWHWQCPEMMWINFGSLAIWGVGFYLLRKGVLSISLLLVTLEVVFQSFVSVKYVGLDFGFQFYLIPMMAGLFLIPLNWRIQVLLVALLGVDFLFLTIWNPIPLLEISYESLNITYAINLLLGAFGLTAMINMLFINIAEKAESALVVEHQRSEQILHSILPEAIAHRLKSAEIIADRIGSASILFADIVNFTQLSRSMSPSMLLDTLNSVFSDLDDLVDEFQLEKIKTIGDAYMVASGVPFSHPYHAQQLANFALALRELLKIKSAQLGLDLQMRIGIHSGSVVAGVIGHKRFQYDLWGETVNTASRMESHGIPSEIQVTEETAALLQEQFHLQMRGVIEVKGIGPITTWLLLGRKNTTSIPLVPST